MTHPSPDIETFTLHVAGARHRIRTIRPPDAAGPWLVLLHEGLGSIPQWGPFPEQLSASLGANTVVYDRRNHGGSDPLPEPRTVSYHRTEAEILDAMLDELALDDVVTYGHSDGATIALLHAAHSPGRVAAVVSAAGHVVAEPVARAGIMEAQRRFADGGLRDALARAHGHRTDAMFRAWSDTWLHPSFEHWSIVDELHDVVAPVLVIQGADDEYATAAHVDWIADAVAGPAETWLIPAVGHAPHREVADAVIARVQTFVERWVAG